MLKWNALHYHSSHLRHGARHAYPGAGPVFYGKGGDITRISIKVNQTCLINEYDKLPYSKQYLADNSFFCVLFFL